MAKSKNIGIGLKPNLDKGLFWDWRYDEIDWQKSYRSVIEKVLERGTMEEWEEIIRFYGKPRIITALKEEIKFLPDYIINAVSSYFNIRKEEMACYVRKQLRKGQWI
ncbi:DUF6922 domain-containing protein [Agriterribacter humi]|jgi:hypothetical protein|uniref:DUF6922 domain-containing protein n=1 Tax=Agriterribacter humi TaxID=1104781 RepID=UPI00126555A6|nr:hypothetical protein [Agriterribacter humi]